MLELRAMHKSAATRAGALLLNASRTAKQAPGKLQSIGQTIMQRSKFISNNLPKKPPLPKRSFGSASWYPFANKKPSQPFITTQSWWQRPAEIAASIVGGIGLINLSISLYQQWALTNIELYIDKIKADLAAPSLDQIKDNIKKLEYYTTIDQEIIQSKAKQLLKDLRNLYLTKKYAEMPVEAFLQNIHQNPGLQLVYLQDDILSIQENDIVTIPAAIATKLIAIKSTPAAQLLLENIDQNTKMANYILKDNDNKYSANKAKNNLATLNAIKNMLTPDQLDQPEPHASDGDANVPLLPF